MKVIHPEQAITKLIDGKKFTTYIDAYEEDLGEFKCPCCKSEMRFQIDSERMGPVQTIGVYKVICDECSLYFYGFEEYYNGFIDKKDFLTFVKGRLNLSE